MEGGTPDDGNCDQFSNEFHGRHDQSMSGHSCLMELGIAPNVERECRATAIGASETVDGGCGSVIFAPKPNSQPREDDARRLQEDVNPQHLHPAATRKQRQDNSESLFSVECNRGSSPCDSRSPESLVANDGSEDNQDSRHQSLFCSVEAKHETLADPPPQAGASTQESELPNSSRVRSIRNMPLSQLVALGLVPPQPDVHPPSYPAHLPPVRCCYDSKQIKDCTRGNNCYHLHRDEADRCRPQNMKTHEVYIPRPHFIAFNNSSSSSSTEVFSSLPCNYGLQCKDRQHHSCAVRHMFGETALAEYKAYLRRYRSYEFELIRYYLLVNKARRELTDEDVGSAAARRNSGAVR